MFQLFVVPTSSTNNHILEARVARPIPSPTLSKYHRSQFYFATGWRITSSPLPLPLGRSYLTKGTSEGDVDNRSKSSNKRGIAIIASRVDRVSSFEQSNRFHHFLPPFHSLFLHAVSLTVHFFGDHHRLRDARSSPRQTFRLLSPSIGTDGEKTHNLALRIVGHEPPTVPSTSFPPPSQGFSTLRLVYRSTAFWLAVVFGCSSIRGSFFRYFFPGKKRRWMEPWWTDSS